jgi:hypothetical protein
LVEGFGRKVWSKLINKKDSGLFLSGICILLKNLLSWAGGGAIRPTQKWELYFLVSPSSVLEKRHGQENPARERMSLRRISHKTSIQPNNNKRELDSPIVGSVEQDSDRCITQTPTGDR